MRGGIGNCKEAAPSRHPLDLYLYMYEWIGKPVFSLEFSERRVVGGADWWAGLQMRTNNF